MLAFNKNSKLALTILALLHGYTALPLFAEGSSITTQPSESPTPSATTLSATTVPTVPTPSPVIYHSLCSELENESDSVIDVINNLPDDLQRENCAVFQIGQFDDIAPIINELPENTTIILSSELTAPASTVVSDMFSTESMVMDISSSPVVDMATSTKKVRHP